MVAFFELLDRHPKITMAMIPVMILIAGYIGAPPELAGF